MKGKNVKALEAIGLAVVSLFVIAVASFLYGIFTMLLWNWLMPSIFDLPAINFWQAYGLTVLCSVLFKPSTSSSSK